MALVLAGVHGALFARLQAPEFYDNLAVCESWSGVIVDYILRPEIGPFNRVKRAAPKAMDSEAALKEMSKGI